jgi:hypothetical protein
MLLRLSFIVRLSNLKSYITAQKHDTLCRYILIFIHSRNREQALKKKHKFGL